MGPPGLAKLRILIDSWDGGRNGAKDYIKGCADFVLGKYLKEGLETFDDVRLAIKEPREDCCGQRFPRGLGGGCVDAKRPCSFMLCDLFDLEPCQMSFDVFEHEHVVMNPSSAGMGYCHHRITCKFTLVIINRYGDESALSLRRIRFHSCTSHSRYWSVSKQTTRQPNSTQLNNEDLQQIHPDDLEEMDLRDQQKKSTTLHSWLTLLQFITLSDYDWSDQAEEGPTNFALMAYSSTSSNSEVSTDSNYSSSCLENVKILKEQNEQLLKDLRTSKINAITYKTGLESVEARLLVYKKNEYVYEEDIKLLKRNFMPPKPDLSFSGLEEFLNEPIVSEPTVKKSIVETSEAKDSTDKPKEVRKNNGAPIIEDWVSDSKEEDVPQAKIQKKINTHSPRGNQRNWNYMMSQRLGSNFEMINKACYVCGSFDHLQYDCDNHQRQFNNEKMVKPVWNYTQRVNHQNFSRMSHPNPKRNMIPKAVLMRSGLVSLTTARPVNTAQPKTTVNSARPMTNVFNKAHSTIRKPINNKTTTKKSNFNQDVNTIKDKNVNTARPKAVVNTAKPKAVVNAVQGNQVNAVKASTCWV
ncbi:hypothetical protein Tco_0991976 [Tanacetum coccineum]|uniref:CCHC-type domain-containing protein n=1 Tax=Tanacetum coccineum TaxID=301880 RepID=A0ABQ5F2G7_9ASTR